MRITSYAVGGTESYGVVTEAGIVDARPLAGGAQTLRDAIARNALDEIAEAAANRAPDHRIEDVEFLPVVPNPDKILCVGLNYRSHVLEGGNRPAPEWPMIFTRSPILLLSPAVADNATPFYYSQAFVKAYIGKMYNVQLHSFTLCP